MEQAWTDFIAFLDNHQLATGFVLGFLASFINSMFYDWIKRRGLRAKQQQFIEELNESMDRYVEVTPKDEEEVERIRQEIASKVKELSRKLFGKSIPQFESFRLDTSTYPEIDCKWCNRPHKALPGPRGACKHCKLPLDFWIGCHRESEE